MRKFFVYEKGIGSGLHYFSNTLRAIIEPKERADMPHIRRSGAE